MVAVINDPQLQQQLMEERWRTGADKYDEVWEGIYMMAPLASNEHQRLVGKLYVVLDKVIGGPKHGDVFPGVNVSDRRDDWTENFRCPDVAVFLNGTEAEDHDTFWFGGPDFVIEVVSPNDRAREKLDFYAKVRTRELLLVDCSRRTLELYRLENEKLIQVGRSTVDFPNVLQTQRVPLTWQLSTGTPQPKIIIAHTNGKDKWTI